MKIFQLILFTLIIKIVVAQDNIFRVGWFENEKETYGYFDANKQTMFLKTNEADHNEFRRYRYKNGYAIFNQSNSSFLDSFGLIDKSGKFLIPPIYKSIKFMNKSNVIILEDYQDNLKIFDHNLKPISVITNIHNRYIKIDNEEFYMSPVFSDSVCFAKNVHNGKVAILNIFGKVILKPTKKFSYCSVFSEGVALVSGKDAIENDFFIDKYGTKKIMLNNDLIPLCSFQDGISILESKNKTKSILKKDGTIIKIVDDVEEVYTSRDVMSGCSDIDNKDYLQYLFKSGLIPAKQKNSGLWGYINLKGKWQIQPQFQEARSFYNDSLAVAKDAITNLYGFINKQGKFIVSPEFVSLTRLYNKIAFFQKQGQFKWGIINTNGTILYNDHFFLLREEFFL